MIGESYHWGLPTLYTHHKSHSYYTIILYMRPADERRRYIVTSSPIGWAHAQNHPCYCNQNYTRMIYWISCQQHDFKMNRSDPAFHCLCPTMFLRWKYEDLSARSRHLGHGYVITSHSILWDVITYILHIFYSSVLVCSSVRFNIA